MGIHGACHAFDIPECNYNRWIAPKKGISATQPKKHHRALDEGSRAEVLATLTSEKYQDKAPRVVVAMLLDEEQYLCSSSTMYRILEENMAVKERREQLRHPNFTKPELIATGPNQVWTWDITKIKTGIKFKCHHLYVIIDMFSRYVVGWAVHSREDAKLAK